MRPLLKWWDGVLAISGGWVNSILANEFRSDGPSVVRKDMAFSHTVLVLGSVAQPH